MSQHVDRRKEVIDRDALKDHVKVSEILHFMRNAPSIDWSMPANEHYKTLMMYIQPAVVNVFGEPTKKPGTPIVQGFLAVHAH